MQCYLRMTWCYVKAHAKKQKGSLKYGEMRLRIRGYESAGTRRNTYHRLPVMTKLNLVGINQECNNI